MTKDLLKQDLLCRLAKFENRLTEIGILDEVQKEVQTWWFDHLKGLDDVRSVTIGCLEFYRASNKVIGRRSIPTRVAKPWPEIRFSYTR